MLHTSFILYKPKSWGSSTDCGYHCLVKVIGQLLSHSVLIPGFADCEQINDAFPFTTKFSCGVKTYPHFWYVSSKEALHLCLISLSKGFANDFLFIEVAIDYLH